MQYNNIHQYKNNHNSCCVLYTKKLSQRMDNIQWNYGVIMKRSSTDWVIIYLIEIKQTQYSDTHTHTHTLNAVSTGIV